MKLKKHRQKCYLELRKYLGLCIDGMDQKKTELPHFTKVLKNMDAKYFIVVHVVGCLVFNHRLRAKVYLNYPNVHSDLNLTIRVIQDILD
jgi:tRNA G26 N,N-dimethylase Trm1